MNLQAHTMAGTMGKIASQPMFCQNSARRGINITGPSGIPNGASGAFLRFQYSGVKAPGAAIGSPKKTVRVISAA